jgi:hypothetical protein
VAIFQKRFAIRNFQMHLSLPLAARRINNGSAALLPGGAPGTGERTRNREFPRGRSSSAGPICDVAHSRVLSCKD